MASTTTLKLPDALKERIAPLAEREGKTAHAWMVEALEAQAELAEKRRSLYADAEAAWQEVQETGQSYRAEDVHAYVLARAAGKPARRPRPVKA